jgi:hypothetical protein
MVLVTTSNGGLLDPLFWKDAKRPAEEQAQTSNEPLLRVLSNRPALEI